MINESPNLILDFEIKNESVFIRFYNASEYEAYDVTVKFSDPIPGLGATKNIPELRIFKELAYFAPHKEFMIYVDELDSFFSHLKKEEILIQITYLDADKKKFEKKITHHLGIYRDLPMLIKK